MLYEFLIAEKEAILARCLLNLVNNGDRISLMDKIDRGLPIFYDELVGVLKHDEKLLAEVSVQVSDSIHRTSAERCGKESMRNGYTISQVVHGYGALCQAITMHAAECGKEIKAREFNRLNFCLDIAIAESVTEYSRVRREVDAKEEVLRLGFLAHEMRNALDNMALAHQLIKRGIVGVNSSTNQVLENGLSRMASIIDRSLSEVRMGKEPVLESRRCRLMDLIGGVETMAAIEAEAKSILLQSDVPAEIYIAVDEHLVMSAISNLVQNAIKFSKPGATVTIRAKAVSDRVLIEVEDQCGGLPEGKIDELFNPYVQKASNKQGVGLGLSISKRAIQLNSGQIYASDIPGIGCKFIIDLPLADLPESDADNVCKAIH